jgi:hypothetical protein
VGKNAVQVAPGKIRSANGVWQYRAKPVDYLNNHVHIEKLDPEKGCNLQLTTGNFMKYQLVLQWPASSVKDYDTMVEIEDVLVSKLSGASEVDGHDAGSGEMNIFIHTNQPFESFSEIKSILGSYDFWVDARVAYRAIGQNEYIVLWPRELEKFVIA